MKIIELSGIDGSGKTTAVKYMIEKLRERGFKVLDTREVGNPNLPAAVELRKIVLHSTPPLNGKAMELIFSAMRIMNQDYYASVKGEYDFAVSDRGWLDHLAYTDNNVSSAFTHELYQDFLSFHVKQADLLVYLEVSPKIGASRIRSRNGQTDVIEAKGLSFQEKVADSFDKYILTSDQPVWTIDGNGTLEEVKAQVDTLVEGLSTGEKFFEQNTFDFDVTSDC